MKKLIIPLLACLALTGCHKKSAAEIAQEQAVAREAEKRKIKEMYAHKYTVDYLLDSKEFIQGPFAKKELNERCGTMSLYGKIGHFSYSESTNFMQGKSSYYAITLTPLSNRNEANNGSSRTMQCIINSKALAKKIIDMNVGQVVKVRGYYDGNSITARFIDIVHSENLPDYIGTVPSWTQQRSRYQAMGVDKFVRMVSKNSLRESKRLNNKYFTLKGRFTAGKGNSRLFSFQISGKKSVDNFGNDQTNSIQAWLSDKSVQKQMLDSSIRNGQKVAVTGKLYWNGGDYPVMTDINSVKRR